MNDTLEGLLLSDGCLQRAARSHRWHYQQTCCEPTFLQWAVERLPTTPAKIKGPYGASGYFSVRTHVHEEYGEARERWYRNGHKAIPPDFHPTPDAMLAAHLGDGSVRRRPAGRCIRLSLCAFARDDLERLVGQLHALGFPFRVKHLRGSYHELALWGEATDRYLAWIGSCPLPAYDYKWDLGQPAPLVCGRCGCSRDTFTRGCSACRSRRWARRKLGLAFA